MGTLVVSCDCGQSMRVLEQHRGKNGRCPRCARTVWVPNAHESCTRCRRPFRGSWDQQPSAQGIICHVCANQYVATPREAPAEQVFDITAELNQTHKTPSEPAPVPTRKRLPGWTKFALVAGLILVVSGVILSLPEFSIDSKFFMTLDTDGPLDPQILMSAMALRALCTVGFWVLILYRVLHAADALPSPRLRDNLFVLLALSILIHATNLFAGFNLYVGFVVVVLQLKLIDHLFDLNMRHLLLLVLLYALLSPLFLFSQTAIINLLLRYGGG